MAPLPALDNPRHEKFVQALAKGETQREAYRTAISKECSNESADEGACRLANDVKVQARLAEWRSIICERAAISLERIAVEYAKIGFSDIRKAVKWHNSIQVTEEGDVPTLASNVLAVPSDEIDDSTAAAISEISQGPKGLKVKMHDKKGALDSLTKMLGGFVEKHEHTGANGKDLIPPSDPIEIARQVAFLLETASREEKG